MICDKPHLKTGDSAKNMLSGILLSIVIPALNEEENLGFFLTELSSYLKEVQIDHEIIVIDDGSFDKTKYVASQNGAIVFSNQINQGKGFSLRRGFEHAKGEIIITMDADGSHDPRDIRKLLLPVLNGTDVAVGSRFNTAEGRKTTTQINLFGNHLINLAFLILTGNFLTDSQSGFRAIKSNILKQMRINSKGFDIETELTLKPLIYGYSLREVPISIRNRVNGKSRVNPLRDGLKIFRQIIELTLIN